MAHRSTLQWARAGSGPLLTAAGPNATISALQAVGDSSAILNGGDNVDLLTVVLCAISATACKFRSAYDSTHGWPHTAQSRQTLIVFDQVCNYPPCCSDLILNTVIDPAPVAGSDGLRRYPPTSLAVHRKCLV